MLPCPPEDVLLVPVKGLQVRIDAYGVVGRGTEPLPAVLASFGCVLEPPEPAPGCIGIVPESRGGVCPVVEPLPAAALPEDPSIVVAEAASEAVGEGAALPASLGSASRIEDASSLIVG